MRRGTSLLILRSNSYLALLLISGVCFVSSVIIGTNLTFLGYFVNAVRLLEGVINLNSVVSCSFYLVTGRTTQDCCFKLLTDLLFGICSSVSSILSSEWDETLQDTYLCCTFRMNMRAENSSFFSRFILCRLSPRWTELSVLVAPIRRGDEWVDVKVRVTILVEGCLGVSCLGVSKVC